MNDMIITLFNDDEQHFEWNDKKDETNYIKHGLHLKNAIFVFGDENRIEYYDIDHSCNEDRYITIGRVDEIIVVVYTERNSCVRIISARKATKLEEKLYYDHS